MEGINIDALEASVGVQSELKLKDDSVRDDKEAEVKSSSCKAPSNEKSFTLGTDDDSMNER